MLLAIDAGNTETVVGLYELDGADATAGADDGTDASLDEGPRPPLAALDVAARTPDEHAVVLTQLLGPRGARRLRRR